MQNLYRTLARPDFEALRGLDTCNVSNALERFEVRLRNEGFVQGTARCCFPSLGPMLGYAATAVIRTAAPPIRGNWYYDRIEWWRYLASIPEPRVMILQDVDPVPGVGAFVGEIHANIGLALHCIGCVTNGAVRDLSTVEELGFHLFSGSAAVSHAYAHIVDFGEPVKIGRLEIRPGELVHGDRHGIHTIPLTIAARIPGMMREIQETERALIQACRSPGFSLQGLEDALDQVRRRLPKQRSRTESL
jgi:regulator of RNase E activity RraA